MCCPEHMWRTGPAFSPSRARRAAVSGSSGAPSEPQARCAWLTPDRRYSPWRVRTWRSSPECELAMIAISAGSRSNAAMPPASISASSPNGLTRRAERHDAIGVAELADDPARPTSVSTMSPRWTLSSMPSRRWRARIGAAVRPAGGGAASTNAPDAARRVRRVRARSIGLRYGSAAHDAGTARIPRRLLRWAAPGMPDDRRPSTSRSTRRSSTSSRSCATRGPSRRSSARSSASCRGCSATRRWPTSASGRSRSGPRSSR